mgnify:CR=1 FL=1
MIAAFDGFTLDDALAQRHLPMRAAILKRKNTAILRAYQSDRMFAKTTPDRLSALDVLLPRDGVPEIRVYIHTAQIDGRDGRSWVYSYVHGWALALKFNVTILTGQKHSVIDRIFTFRKKQPNGLFRQLRRLHLRHR